MSIVLRLAAFAVFVMVCLCVVCCLIAFCVLCVVCRNILLCVALCRAGGSSRPHNVCVPCCLLRAPSNYLLRMSQLPSHVKSQAHGQFTIKRC